MLRKVVRSQAGDELAQHWTETVAKLTELQRKALQTQWFEPMRVPPWCSEPGKNQIKPCCWKSIVLDKK